MRWQGSVAFVTGASRGIGAAVARAATARGARVGLVARSRDDLERLAAELEGAQWAVADVSRPEEIEAAIRGLTDRLGPPQILVNNAGVGAYRPFLEELPETFERLMAVNFMGTLHAIRAALPSMIDSGRGHIVNVASVAGRLGAPFESAYSASKFAVVGLTESLTAELRPLGVRVSLVNPGPVATQFTEARGKDFTRERPRPRQPSEIADAVVKAVEAGRFEQTIPRWLRFPIAVRSLTPELYARGLVRNASKEAAEAARSWRERG